MATTVQTTGGPGGFGSTPAQAARAGASAQESAWKRSFNDFLELELGAEQQRYSERLRGAVETSEPRFLIDMADLREADAGLAQAVIMTPAEVIPVLERSLQENVLVIDNQYPFKEMKLGFTGDLGQHHVTPRRLGASMLSRMVRVEGIVTKCSLVRPKVSESVHYCEKTKKFHVAQFRDVTSLEGTPTSTVYPTRDENNNLLSTEFGLSTFRDHQSLSLQEMPESAPAGQLPRSVDIVMEDDLVDKVKPGDRVRIYGVYRAVTGRNASSAGQSGTFRTLLLASNIVLLSHTAAQLRMKESTLTNIRRFAASFPQGNDLVTQLSRSMGPSIYGHEMMKKALLLVLIGGRERNLENGTHIRGDVNMLMVGDPSTAKSQLLRFAMQVAPLAISTTGRGSSGVGLTAAVVADPETGERQLQAGAMVLADRGLVCIDEFDKMSDADRVAMHEVMEQQTVTIAKAGVHTSLNARCSVLAAANPVYGNYDPARRPMDNIGLPDSLLSRFDLLFIVLDSLSADQDRMVAEHVLKLHRFRSQEEDQLDVAAATASAVATATATAAGRHSSSTAASTMMADIGDADDGLGLSDEKRKGDDSDEDDDEADDGSGDTLTRIFQKFNPLLHKERNVLKVSFLRKYIQYAKSRIQPDLTPEACDKIATAYAELRSEAHGEKNALPITPRTLETLIRLSTAHAKARLSQIVAGTDADEAIRLLKYALYQENLVEQAKRSVSSGQKRRETSRISDSEDSDEDGAGASSSQRSVRKARESKPNYRDADVRDDPRDADFGSEQEADDPFAFEDAEVGKQLLQSQKKKAKKGSAAVASTFATSAEPSSQLESSRSAASAKRSDVPYSSPSKAPSSSSKRDSSVPFTVLAESEPETSAQQDTDLVDEAEVERQKQAAAWRSVAADPRFKKFERVLQAEIRAHPEGVSINLLIQRSGLIREDVILFVRCIAESNGVYFHADSDTVYGL